MNAREIMPARAQGLCWREILQMGADTVILEGLAMEHLIDRYRSTDRQSEGAK